MRLSKYNESDWNWNGSQISNSKTVSIILTQTIILTAPRSHTSRFWPRFLLNFVDRTRISDSTWYGCKTPCKWYVDLVTVALNNCDKTYSRLTENRKTTRIWHRCTHIIRYCNTYCITTVRKTKCFRHNCLHKSVEKSCQPMFDLKKKNCMAF